MNIITYDYVIKTGELQPEVTYVDYRVNNDQSLEVLVPENISYDVKYTYVPNLQNDKYISLDDEDFAYFMNVIQYEIGKFMKNDKEVVNSYKLIEDAEKTYSTKQYDDRPGKTATGQGFM